MGRWTAPAPHLLAGCLCVGLALAVPFRAPAATAVALPVVALATILWSGGARVVLLGLVLLGAGFCWGSLRAETFEASVLREHRGQSRMALLEVTGPARRSLYGTSVPVRVRRFGRIRLSERSRLELPPGRAPPQGALLETVVTVRELAEADSPGDFDEAGYLRRQGVHVVLAASWVRIVGRRAGLGGIADALRNHVARTLASGSSGDRRALLAGVVLGEDEGLDPGERDAFRASGLYHLLAVSGQNVAYVAGGALLLAWLLGLARRPAQLLVLAAIAAYVLSVGWQPSVARAGVAGALTSLAWLAGRLRDRWYFLLVGVAVLLGWNPYTLLDPGFQLSFAAVAAIFIGVPPLRRALGRYALPGLLTDVVAVSVACSLATAPILWVHFGQLPAYGVLANALVAPLFPPLLGLSLTAVAVEPLLPEAAAGLVWLAGWLGEGLGLCARLVAGLPGAQVSSTESLLLFGAAGSLVLVALASRSRRARRVVTLALMAAVAAGGWQLIGEPSAPSLKQGFRVSFLDVGQGDAILLQVPEGAVLVDQGPPEADVAGQLAALGVSRIEALVLTHPQRDHVGGAEEVLEQVEVALVLDPRLPFESFDEQRALAEAHRRGVPVQRVRTGQSWRIGKLRLWALWPDRAGRLGEDPNMHALVLLASFGTLDLLLTADAESDVLERLSLPQVEVLKVSHHGSADPGLPGVLGRLQPRVAVISVGADNDYGHPASSTLAALAAVPGLAIFRTDQDGRIVLESDGSGVSIETER